MHISLLDPYRSRRSLIHRLDPRLKLSGVVATVVAVSLLPVGAWPVFILFAALVLGIVILSELGPRYVLRRSLLSSPFFLAAFPLLFTTPGAPLASWHILGHSVALSMEGLDRFLSIAIKSWLSVVLTVVLAGSTPFPDLLVALRSLRVPRLLVAVFGLMWRYLFVLADEAVRLLRARAARSASLWTPPDGVAVQLRMNPSAGPARLGVPGGTVMWRARVVGGMAGSLFLRSFDRGDRIYAAMAARGYDGEVRTLPLAPLRAGALAALCVWLIGLVLLVGVAHLLIG